MSACEYTPVSICKYLLMMVVLTANSLITDSLHPTDRSLSKKQYCISFYSRLVIPSYPKPIHQEPRSSKQNQATALGLPINCTELAHRKGMLRWELNTHRPDAWDTTFKVLTVSMVNPVIPREQLLLYYVKKYSASLFYCNFNLHV